MAARGHIPPAYEGRAIQAPGMMRHVPLPGIGSAVHHPLEPAPLPELEHNLAFQAAEINKLAKENQRLAATHVALRRELVVTQQEMQRLQAHAESVQTESGIQIRGLSEKIGKMEVDIHAGEVLKKELQQAHLEAQSVISERQDLTVEIQKTTEELHKVNADFKRLPELHAELDGLRQEHQQLRVAFEYEKGLNIEQVEQMRAMEKNLISMAREVEKLRAEVSNSEKRGHAPNPYGEMYGSPDPVYPPAGHGTGYLEHGSYSHGGGYGRGGPASYVDGHSRSPVPMSGGAMGGAMHAYGGVTGGGHTDAYRRPQVPVADGLVAGEGVNPYLGVTGGGSYDAIRGAPRAARR